jgi:hypothetical protein
MDDGREFPAYKIHQRGAGILYHAVANYDFYIPVPAESQSGGQRNI